MSKAGPFKNIMFKDERIAYEVSMNDTYAANDPVGGNVLLFLSCCGSSVAL
jgi:hypothetical protein